VSDVQGRDPNSQAMKVSDDSISEFRFDHVTADCSNRPLCRTVGLVYVSVCAQTVIFV